MSGFVYTILEYLAWIAVALLLGIVLSACAVIALAIFRLAHSLAVRWNLIAKANHPEAPGPVSASSIRTHSLRSPESSYAKRSHGKLLVDKPQPPPEPSAGPERHVS